MKKKKKDITVTKRCSVWSGYMKNNDQVNTCINPFAVGGGGGGGIGSGDNSIYQFLRSKWETIGVTISSDGGGINISG